MENGVYIDNGYILLPREDFEGPIFCNEGLWKLWTWCIYEAWHQPKDLYLPINTGKGKTGVKLTRGQFIFNRKHAADGLGSKPETTRKRIKKLEALGKITIESTNHCTIVTVCNYDTYQNPNNPNYQVMER